MSRLRVWRMTSNSNWTQALCLIQRSGYTVNKTEGSMWTSVVNKNMFDPHRSGLAGSSKQLSNRSHYPRTDNSFAAGVNDEKLPGSVLTNFKEKSLPVP